MDKFGQLNEESCSRLDLVIEKFHNKKYSFIISNWKVTMVMRFLKGNLLSEGW